ncbi:hypothetical protein [Nocardioides daphniae]|uniref:Uncharacterized protein n=1 Tax=Nocardioides daphniae TaxID=402297 RepID=A0ABQ1QL85_9ACTN|nr:hypothetical protein [Nocardioides daphniae]GGD31273.1 hypothetical protein GCM10007231_33550 [Nocardioides daphniae]
MDTSPPGQSVETHDELRIAAPHRELLDWARTHMSAIEEARWAYDVALDGDV